MKLQVIHVVSLAITHLQVQNNLGLICETFLLLVLLVEASLTLSYSSCSV